MIFLNFSLGREKTESLLEKPDPILREGAPVRPEPEGNWKPEKDYFVDGCRIEAGFR